MYTKHGLRCIIYVFVLLVNTPQRVQFGLCVPAVHTWPVWHVGCFTPRQVFYLRRLVSLPCPRLSANALLRCPSRTRRPPPNVAVKAITAPFRPRPSVRWQPKGETLTA